MSFKKASDVLKKQKMPQKMLQAAWICYQAQKEIDFLFKNKDILAASYKNGILNLKVSNPILAGEARLKAEALKNKINQKLKKNLIKRISTQINR